MFNLRKRIESIEKKLDKIQVSEERLFKFYLERKIDEINAKLKNKMTISSENTTIYYFFTSRPGTSIKIKIADITLFNKEIPNVYLHNFNNIGTEQYKEALMFLDSKSISYFIKLDKKLEEIKKKKLNLEEELKKMI